MRVAHIRSEFSVITELYIYDIALETLSRGIDSHIICSKQLNIDTRPYPYVHTAKDTIKENPNKIYYKFIDKLSPSVYNQPRHKIMAYASILDKVKPDVVHVHFAYEAGLCAAWCLSNKTPLIISYHGNDLSGLLIDTKWLAAYKSLWSIASYITVVSKFQRNRLIDMGVSADKVHIIRTGKRLSDYPYSQRHDVPSKLISVGRLIEKKGHDDALRALAQYNSSQQHNNRLRLAIVGGGPLKDYLHNLAHELNIHRYCTFVGEIQHDRVIELLKSSDAFMLCSKTSQTNDEEGVPGALLEAQAIGLPCISTYHAGIPEGVPCENHNLLALESNINEIAGCLNRLRHMTSVERLQVSKMGRMHIEKHFDLDDQIDNLTALYSASSK